MSSEARIRELEAENARLRATSDEQQATIDELQELARTLTSEVALLKRSLFGNRRERFDDPRQGTLFDAEWVGDDEGDDEDDSPSGSDGPQGGGKRKKGRGRFVFPETMPRKQVKHPLREEDLPEHLRGRDDLRRFFKKIREYLELTPATGYVVEELVEVLAADNEDRTQTEMLSASPPPRILDCYAGPSLLATLAVERFADYLPYYREEERLRRLDISIPRSTISRWMIRLAGRLDPLVERMRRAALKSQVVCVDETSVKLLDPDLPQAKSAYLWAVVGDAAHPYVTFYFTEDRSRAGPEQFLRDFDGYLTSDAYVCYESLQQEWSAGKLWACCHSHARRKFEALHHLGATRETSTALGYFQRLFAIEDETRPLTDQQRLAVREERMRPVLEEFKAWMDAQLASLRPKHPLRGAIQYMTKRWESFTRVLECGAIPLENNEAERAVKLPVIGRKNHLFFARPAGGQAAMALYTLTATCRRLHIDPQAYLHDVFVRLPAMSGEQVAELLPDRWLAAHPQHKIKLREDEASSRAQRKRTSRAQRRKALARAQRGG